MSEETAPEEHSGATSAAQPWKQRDGETDRAFEAFRAFLEMGRDRTLQRTSDAIGHRHPRTVRGWSAQHDWMARARAWDERQDAVADAAAVEQRENLMREMVRDRVRYQRLYHRHLAGVPDILSGIAADDDASPSARVAACRIIIEQAGYQPIEPPQRDDRVEDMVVNELLRLSKALADADAARADLFDTLVAEAFERRQAQLREAAGDDDEAD